MALLGIFFLRRLRHSPLRVKITVVVLGAMLAAPLGFVTCNNVAEKLVGSGRGSPWARQYDLITGQNIVAENPLIGIGFDPVQYREAAKRLGYVDAFAYMNPRFIEDRSTTNGIVYLLYSIGVPLSLPFLVGIFRQTLLPGRMPVALLLFLSFIGESLILTPFFLLIIFSGLLRRPRESASFGGQRFGPAL